MTEKSLTSIRIRLDPLDPGPYWGKKLDPDNTAFFNFTDFSKNILNSPKSYIFVNFLGQFPQKCKNYKFVFRRHHDQEPEADFTFLASGSNSTSFLFLFLHTHSSMNMNRPNKNAELLMISKL